MHRDHTCHEKVVLFMKRNEFEFKMVAGNFNFE